MGWDDIRNGIANKVDNVGLAIDQHQSGVTGDRTDPIDRSANTVSSMFGSRSATSDGGVAGRWATGVQNAAKGWGDLFSPAPLLPGQAPPSTADKAVTAVRLAQQTVGGLMSLINLPKEMMDVGFANLTAPLAAMFPSLPAATLGTMHIGTPHTHVHPPSLIPPAPPIPLPSIGPVTLGTCVRVLISGRPAARCGDLGIAPTCGGFAPMFQIKTGSSNVFIGGNRAARLGDITTACAQGSERNTDASAFMQALGKIAETAGKVLVWGGRIAQGLAIAADAAEAAQASAKDEAAMAQAKALAATMGAAQMAADLAAAAIAKAMGKDPGAPASIGALLAPVAPLVLIGGFPMINIPNPANLLLEHLSLNAPEESPEEEEETGHPG